MTRILAMIGLMSALAAAGVALSAGEKTTPFKNTADEVKIFELTNAERKKKDGKPLALSVALSKLARAHSENMARQEKMEHKLDDKSPFDRMREAKYLYLAGGENIGMGEDGITIEQIMAAWMESADHRKNILAPEYTEIGVGMAKNKKGDTYYTQVFAKPRKK